MVVACNNITTKSIIVKVSPYCFQLIFWKR